MRPKAKRPKLALKVSEKKQPELEIKLPPFPTGHPIPKELQDADAILNMATTKVTASSSSATSSSSSTTTCTTSPSQLLTKSDDDEVGDYVTKTYEQVVASGSTDERNEIIDQIMVDISKDIKMFEDSRGRQMFNAANDYLDHAGDLLCLVKSVIEALLAGAKPSSRYEIGNQSGLETEEIDAHIDHSKDQH